MAALANQYNHSSCSPVTQDKGHISRLDIRDPLCPRPTPHSQSVFLLPHWSPLSTPLAYSQAPPTPRSFPTLPLGPWLILFLDNCHLLLHPCGPKPRSTRVRPFPAAPGTVGQRRGGLLWVTRGFSNCAFPPKPLCVSGDDGKETSQPLPATRHTEPPGSACAFGLFSHVLFEKGVCGGRKCR